MLGTPPAFVLSQDQTLMFNPSQSSVRFRSPRTVVSLRNLTVLCSLSLRLSPSRSPRTLFLLICLHYIVFKDRRCRCSRADNVDYYTRHPPFCQQLFLFSFFLLYTHNSAFSSARKSAVFRTKHSLNQNIVAFIIL